MSQESSPESVDIHAGQVLRAKRKLAGVSQSALAEHCGISFQQIQKYERGTNRMSLSMLWKICAYLKAEPSDFFPMHAAWGEPRLGDALGDIALKLIGAPGGAVLAQAFVGLKPHQATALVNTAQAMASA